MELSFIRPQIILQIIKFVCLLVLLLIIYYLWALFFVSIDNKVNNLSWHPPKISSKFNVGVLGSLQTYKHAAKILNPTIVDSAKSEPKLKINDKLKQDISKYVILKGTVVDSNLDVAFVDVISLHRQKAIYIDDIIEGFTVKSINNGCVYFRRGLQTYKLEVEKPKGLVTPILSSSDNLPGNNSSNRITKKEIKNLIKEPTSLLRDVGFTPKIGVSGNIEGMKIIRIARNSIFAKRGIRVGDVVTSINGHNTTGISAAMALMNDLDKVDKFVIKFKRRGRLKTVVCKVE